MKKSIYYFTGTGNSLMAAKDIAEKLGDSEVIPIAKAIKKNINIKSDIVGIVYPVYIWGIPLIVSKFIKKMNVENPNTYFFAVATNGGKVAGSLLVLNKKLKKKKIKLSSGFSVQMPSNFIPKHHNGIIEKDAEIFNNWRSRLNEIAGTVKAQKQLEIEKGSLKECIIRTGIIYNLASFIIHKSDKSFWLDNNCNGCGTCSKVCPVQNIRMSNKKPSWNHECEFCFACINLCPKQAIQFGKNTAGKNRYKNPLVNIKELMGN